MIYCPQCGTANADTAAVCGNCQTALPVAGAAAAPGAPSPAPGAPPTAKPQINNYLIPAIVVTLCCCLPGGIVAIVYAAQVNSKLQAGDIAGAQAASNNAKLWCMISAGVGLVITLAAIAINLLGVMANF
ncbi:MAG: CD225/dispanin family protein [Terriglobales bacterium]